MKKIVALLLTLVMACSLLTACKSKEAASGGSEVTTAPVKEEKKENKEAEKTESPANEVTEPVTIKFAAWDVAAGTTFQSLVDGFQKQNSNVKVEVIDIPSADYTTKLSVMLNGGSDLDAFFIKDGDTTKALAEKGQLADVSSFIAAEGIELSVYNGLAERFNIDGKTVALPASTGYYVLFYNKDIFDAAGEPYPSNDMTWAEFEEVAKRITSGSGIDKNYGALFHTWNACVQNWGVADGKHTIMDEDLSFFQPYYEMVLRMEKEGSVMDYATLKTSNLHYSNLFMQGTTGMLPMGTWFISTLRSKVAAGESNVNWGIATLPHPEGVEAGYTVGSVTPICINEASAKKEAAWEFMKFVCSEEGAQIYASVGEFSCRGNNDTLAIIANASGMPEGAREALLTKNISLDRPMESTVAEVNQILGEWHSLIMLGEVSIEEGIREMSKLSKEIQGK